MGRKGSMDMDRTEASELEGISDTQESPTSDQDGWDKSANLFTRLVKAQAAAKKLDKTEKANGLKYDYVTHDDVASEAKKILTKNGILFLPTIDSHEQEGNKTIVNVIGTFYNVDKPDEKLATQGLGFGVDNQDKGPGKAYSYACKYILAKTLMLNTSDDIEEHDIDYNPAATIEAVLETKQSIESKTKDWAKSLGNLIANENSFEGLKRLKTDNLQMINSEAVPEGIRKVLLKKIDEKLDFAKEQLLQDEVAEDV